MRKLSIVYLMTLAACGSSNASTPVPEPTYNPAPVSIDPPATDANTPAIVPSPTPTATPARDAALNPTPTPTPTPIDYSGTYLIASGTLLHDGCMNQCPATNADSAALWVTYSDVPPAGYSIVHSEQAPNPTPHDPAVVSDGALAWFTDVAPAANICGADTEQDDYRLTLAGGKASIVKTVYTVGQCHGAQRECLCTYAFAATISP